MGRSWPFNRQPSCPISGIRGLVADLQVTLHVHENLVREIFYRRLVSAVVKETELCLKCIRPISEDPCVDLSHRKQIAARYHGVGPSQVPVNLKASDSFNDMNEGRA